jgi:cell division protein ZipA
MDATTVRIILIIVGALLILGLYLWERSRDPEEDSEDLDYDDDDTPYAAGGQEPRARAFRDLAEAPAAEPPRPRAAAGPEVPRASGRDQPPAPAVDDDGVPAPLLVQLSVAKRYGEFPGADLLEVAESCGLRPGDMDIFHCLDEFEDGTRVYFSMANMVKPGTFPFDDMEGFSTPGVMLFAQLDGKPEDLTILEEMIATARKLATTLGGDVFDDSRRPLTVRKEEEMRNAVLANEARFMRAARR